MKMTTMDDVDIDRILQEELDALSLHDETMDDIHSDDDEDIYQQRDYRLDEQEAERMLQETRDHLECAMKERLAAFQNEVNMNFKRFEIDYDEIDELLKKPVGNINEEIQTNVAQHCGIERVELDQVRVREKETRCRVKEYFI